MKTFPVLLTAMALMNGAGFSAIARADELTPYIECRDKSDPELLISTSPDGGLFIWNKSEFLGLASKTAHALRVGFTADYMTMTVVPNDHCKFVDESHMIGLTYVTCSLEHTASIKIKPTDAPEQIHFVKKGSIQFYANLFYGGQASLTLDFISEDNRHIVINKVMPYESCNFETLPKIYRP